MLQYPKEVFYMKIKKIILRCFCICILLGILAAISVFAINHSIIKTTSEQIVSSEAISDNHYDCILVLGCGVRPDGTPSDMLSDRLKRAVALYKAGVSKKIIMSGDHGRESYDEVNVMLDYAVRNGVPSDAVFTDHAGFSTYESIYRARDIFCVRKMVVVTQRYHLFRSLYICNRLGVDAVGVDSDYHRYVGQKMRDIREIAARCKDFFTCILKPEPTYLGEQLPVSGSAVVSHDKNASS